MVEFKFTDVGEGMHEGEILRVLVKTGEPVTQDQPIFEVQTDKVTAELTAPVSGVVREIFFAEGATIEVGNTLLLIDTGESSAEAKQQTKEQDSNITEIGTKALETGKQQGTAPFMSTVPGFRRALATPYVRQLARELAVDIEQVRGTGASGRVTEEDVRLYAEGKSVATVAGKNETIGVAESNASGIVADEEARAAQADRNQPVVEQPTAQQHRELLPNREAILRQERLPLRGMRKKIAEHMVKSVTIIPHVTSVDELELDRLIAFRESLKPHAAKRNIKLTYLPFFIKALVIALKEFPTFNASIDDETNEIILKQYYNIGIAVDTTEGLVVPVIKDADRKTIFQLAEEIVQLAALARDGKLKREHMTDGTFTISNVGPIGGLQATPIINHPEVAILALHKLEKRWVVRDDAGVIRQMMNTSLSFDHRLIDGVTAVRFTNRIKELLEEPNLLMAVMV
ncbi:2-oxo acid dehydrogenase subunit E2 [Brevibacillus fluminis]|uniref:Dihydrolipoamide acetyltransferase component of pyruvate dehydrogenase complex n=1 Tax=Brevibacillus fluminis TaxID=511487 RepID=A0A3M8D9V8_9BACL|nr:dihydrolipoamide acetyltransferase family protein [Brevibacillus fluminis]RNB84693.1 2-oxo acid dehydrogenase subunit E2 [Brevibacillus fluminis]